MLSRAAHSLYWLSRYLERADNVARFIDVNRQLILDIGRGSESAQWAPLVMTSGDEALFGQHYSRTGEREVIRFLTFDEQNPNSIISCINAARENARTVREILHSDIWEALNELYHRLQQHSRRQRLQSLQLIYRDIRRSNHLLIGLFEAAMSHQEGWHFARLGRMLERADKTARILDVKYFLLLPDAEAVDSPLDAVEWAAVLNSADAFEMYRQQYHRVNYRDAAEFLMISPCFPRSMRYSVAAAARSLSALTEMLQLEVESEHRLQGLRQRMEDLTITQILAEGMHEFIDAFQLELNRIDEAIWKDFFALRS